MEIKMRNLFISNLDKKDVKHFTSDIGLFLRKKMDKSFKKLCNFFTNANIIRVKNDNYLSDEEYYSHLNLNPIRCSSYPLSKKKNANNIVLERYPSLEKDESYIFVGNHTCPEDIETMLNIIDRNAYLILGSVEILRYNPEMYLSWLNGMIVFDILESKSRKNLIPKMERVLKTNSILIFPEGSHNYHPNKLVNNMFDGPVNLALKTGKKIVPISLVRDDKHGVSYIDVGNPIDVCNLHLAVRDYYPKESDNEKYRIKSMSSYLRDKMATAVYHLIARHIEPIERRNYRDIDKYFIDNYVNDSFLKLNWKHDVFDAEFLTKMTKAEQEYTEMVHTLSCLKLNKKTLKETQLNNREYILKEMDLKNKNVITNMRKGFQRRFKNVSVNSVLYQKRKLGK